jgi:hypothetical protein
MVDKYLGQLYPLYREHTRDVLIRQARDILVCTFRGDLTSFERMFLVPAVEIIEKIKQKFSGADTVSFFFLIRLFSHEDHHHGAINHQLIFSLISHIESVKSNMNKLLI